MILQNYTILKSKLPSDGLQKFKVIALVIVNSLSHSQTSRSFVLRIKRGWNNDDRHANVDMGFEI